MKRNILILSTFLLGATLGFAQTEASNTNSKEKTLKVKETTEVKLTEKKQISNDKDSKKNTNPKSALTEQELVELRKNLGVIDLSKPEEVLTREK